MSIRVRVHYSFTVAIPRSLPGNPAHIDNINVTHLPTSPRWPWPSQGHVVVGWKLTSEWRVMAGKCDNLLVAEKCCLKRAYPAVKPDPLEVILGVVGPNHGTAAGGE